MKIPFELNQKIEGLTDEEKSLLRRIEDASRKDTVKDLLPEFSRSTKDRPNSAHQQLRRLRDRGLIHPSEGGAWKEYKHPVVIRSVELGLRESTEPCHISILFVASNPTNESRLRFDEESREIQEKLKLSKQREHFKFHQHTSVRPEDISQALLDIEPKIVHFSGHGETTGALCFENKLGTSHPIAPDALAALFEQFANQVNCVLLNACYSEIQAEVIAKHINYVIGMSQAIGDRAAIAFAIGFYQALGAGRSIREAYKLGCVQIRLQGIPEHLTPVLIKKKQRVT